MTSGTPFSYKSIYNRDVVADIKANVKDPSVAMALEVAKSSASSRKSASGRKSIKNTGRKSAAKEKKKNTEAASPWQKVLDEESGRICFQQLSLLSLRLPSNVCALFARF